MRYASTYRIYYKDSEENACDDYFQAMTAQQAADFAREFLDAAEVI